MVKYLDKNSGFSQWAANKGTEKKDSKFAGIFWWVALFVIAWWLFATWNSPKDKPVAVQNPALIEDVSKVPVSTISNEKISANVQGLRISKIELKDYKQDKNKNSDKNVSLLSGENEFMEVGFNANGTTAPMYDTVWNRGSDNSMSWRNADNINFVRTITTDGYLITVKDEIKNNSGKSVSFAPYTRIVRAGDKDTASVKTGAYSYVNSEIENNSWHDLDKKSYAFETVNGFVGFSDQYWETIASIGSPDQTIRMKKLDTRYQVDSTAGAINIASGKTTTVETKFFTGPKDHSILADASKSITGINETIDYGWFWFLARPMLLAMNALNGFVLNYGLAIVLLTIGLRILMWPLTRKSYTGMVAMQKMQPEMMRIQKLYANDKVRMQMEMMKLYQTHKASPMSGCLPMLLQIPIFFALYKALLISVPMRHAGFLWMSDLSVLDPYFILPIIMGATMWWQQNLQSVATKDVDNNNPMAQTQKFMKWMPLLFTVMFAWMPAGLVLYWAVSNLFGIGQIYVIKSKK